jgi:NAD(P)H dehydrogenase (quinone)
MVKILVVYDSASGNTRKMALAVSEGVKQINGVEVIAKKVEQTKLEDLRKADGIIMGSPTYYGQMSAKLKALIDESVKIHENLKGK